MTDKAHTPDFADLERQCDIPADKYCGLTPELMSRAIVAYHSGPRRHDEPVGYCPIGSPETRLDWMLPNDEFDRAVQVGLRRNFPELTDARSRLPVTLAYSGPQKSKSAALKREAAIKKLPRRAMLELVGRCRRSAGFNEEPLGTELWTTSNRNPPTISSTCRTSPTTTSKPGFWSTRRPTI